jgi:hypothetical protein
MLPHEACVKRLAFLCDTPPNPLKEHCTILLCARLVLLPIGRAIGQVPVPGQGNGDLGSLGRIASRSHILCVIAETN